jgi:hypothetical protein
MEFIGPSTFFGCSGLDEVIFEAGSHLRDIEGFTSCGSLIRIDIPASVESIESSTFSGCSGLNEMIFEAGSHLRDIEGFQFCGSLIRIDIPASIKLIGLSALSECASLLNLRMMSGMRIRAIGRPGGLRAFVVHEDDRHVKLCRRQLHLSTVGFRVSTTWE